MQSNNPIFLNLKVYQNNFIGLKNWLNVPFTYNSFYLLGGTIASSIIGFVFWILAARFVQPSEIGIATAVLSSIGLISTLSDLGLGTGFIRFRKEYNENIITFLNTCFVILVGTTLLFVFIYLLGIPLWTPKLIILTKSTVDICSIIIFTLSTSLFFMQISAMMALRKGSFPFWGMVSSNFPSIILIFIFPFIFNNFRNVLWAYELPIVVVVLVSSLLVIPRYYRGFRLISFPNFSVLSIVWRYGLGNYLANLLWTLPNYLLPIIAINRISAEATAYFFVVWSITSAVFAIPRSVTGSLFAEGSYDENNFKKNITKACILILGMAIPVVVFLWFGGSFILRIFGRPYVNIPLLRLILLSTIPFSINSIIFTILRVRKQVMNIILYSASVSITCLLLSYFLSLNWDLLGLGSGWVLGQSISPLIFLSFNSKRLFGNK